LPLDWQWCIAERLTEMGAPTRFSDQELSLASLGQINHLSKNWEKQPVVFLEEL
jgi:hypothetical protein